MESLRCPTALRRGGSSSLTGTPSRVPEVAAVTVGGELPLLLLLLVASFVVVGRGLPQRLACLAIALANFFGPQTRVQKVDSSTSPVPAIWSAPYSSRSESRTKS